MAGDAYLLLWYRTDPGLTGDPCTHVGIWPTLAGAQAYSDEWGGVGTWRFSSYDGGEVWTRASKHPHLSHMIEGLPFMGEAAAARATGDDEGET